MRVMRTSLVLALSVGLPYGCVSAPIVNKPLPRPSARASAAVSAAPVSLALIGLNGQPLISQDGGGLISQDGGGLISQDGGGLISQDGGGLISQDGGGISGTVKAPPAVVSHDGGTVVSHDGGTVVSHDGGTVVSHDGGTAVSEMGGMYHLDALAEVPVAGAHVYLRTADGKIVTDAAGKPLTAVVDAAGHFSFPKLVPKNGIEVFVPLAASQSKVQALVALYTKDHAVGAAVNINLATTVLGSYVLDKYVGDPGVKDKVAGLARLTAKLNDAALADAATALGDTLPPALLEPLPANLDGFLDTAQKNDPRLQNDMVEIKKAIVLAGVSQTSAQRADQISLAAPQGVAVDSAGNAYVTIGTGGVIWKIAPNGAVQQLLGPGAITQTGLSFSQVGDIRVGPDGFLYFVAPYAAQVLKMSTDGKVGPVAVAGGGSIGGAVDPHSQTGGAIPTGTRALDAALVLPRSLEFAADGSLYVGESPNDYQNDVGRLLKIKDGLISSVALPPADVVPGRTLVSLTSTPDGALWVFDYTHHAILRLDPNGTWGVPASGLPINRTGGLLAQPDSAVLVSLGEGNKVIKLDKRGAMTPFAGSGDPGDQDGLAASASFAQPGALAAAPDGSVEVADVGNGLLRDIKDGAVTTVAGYRDTPLGSDPRTIPLNLPGGLALDAQGRVVIAEFGGGRIKRLDAGSLTRIAGTSSGFAGDGGPASAARFNQPTGIVYIGNDLYVADVGNKRIRKIDANGIVTTVVGGGEATLNDTPDGGPDSGNKQMATSIKLSRMSTVAAWQGRLYFNDSERVFRLDPDGSLVRVAGAQSNTPVSTLGGPERADEAHFVFITGLAFNSKGELYIADLGNMRVVKWTAPDKPMPVVAGRDTLTSLSAIADGSAANERDVAATDATLLLPVGLGVDNKDDLYIAELGTRDARDATNVNPALAGALASLPTVPGRLRELTTDGRAHILAGYGAPAGASAVQQPTGVLVDGKGRVLFVDSATAQLEVLQGP